MLARVFGLVGAMLLAVVLASCSPLEGDGRHLVPLSGAAKAQLAAMGSSPQAAMMVRIFKEESKLEVWKQTASGSFRLFKTYDICTWSGELGPKFYEGDRQAPEGFYTITPGLMNPNSNYYLAFNLGFPNKYDRAHGRTGSHLMVHGACSSAGCYAMEDEQIAEIYALAREAFSGGNRSFEVQIFPFRMTAENLAKHQSSPHIDFWNNLKQGHDFFEVAQVPPNWDVCDGRYVFRQPSAVSAAASMAGQCQPVTADQSIVSAYMAKQTADAAALQSAIVRAADAEAAAVQAEERRVAAQAEMEARGEALNSAVNGFFGTLLSPFGGAQPQAQAMSEPVAAEMVAPQS
ncbi:murein L,D-transpeptidase family protein [Pelagibacterium sp. H642]|uniref:murein L,D-transpeptidase family protein n=1 Tax=Pelagibacterium sp. H642 TaxID=1881069 RepID=UPI0028163C73|nr:murein L,D-transpeptidase family protein [Pelagibacterium sp. H642]WMT89251.1 murein L,D-transpeptidase [Pelagibacterium sp. H642]